MKIGDTVVTISDNEKGTVLGINDSEATVLFWGTFEQVVPINELYVVEADKTGETIDNKAYQCTAKSMFCLCCNFFKCAYYKEVDNKEVRDGQADKA